MNKNNQMQKGKLKTLPNELNTNHEEFLFQSACDEDFHNRLNLASPTFATTDLKSQSEMLKENKASNAKVSTIDFLKVQNEKLMSKCQDYKELVEDLENKLKLNSGKLEVCQKALEKKVEKAAKYMMLNNSSQELSNIDIYLELQVFRQDYKKSKEESENLKKENEDLLQRASELEKIITSFTSKSDKKKKESESVDKIEHRYQQQIEELKRTNEIKWKQLENDKKNKEMQIKKCKEDYEKLKFLKDQIEKKRQEDIKARQEISAKLSKQEQEIQQLDHKVLTQKEEINNVTSQKLQLESKLAVYEKNIQEEIENQRVEAQKLQLDLLKLETEQKRIQNKLDSQVKENHNLKQTIEQLQTQKLDLQEDIQTLLKQKSQYQTNQGKMSLKVSELEQLVSDSQNQCTQIKKQFQQWIEEHKNQSKNQINIIESRFQQNIQDLKKDIEQMKKMKQALEEQLGTERDKCSRMSIELQNTYRKMEESGDAYKRNETQDFPMRQRTLPTKTVSQLKMVESILSGILGIEDFQTNKIKCGGNICKDQYIENIVTEIAKEAEQLADIYDGLEGEIDNLRQQVKNKEEVISKLLKFTPQEKKNQILEYLNVMQKIEHYTTEQIYKATRDIEEEAQDWKRYLAQILAALEKNQEELQYLRKMAGRGREPLRQYNNQQRYPEKHDLQRRRFGQY